MKILYIDATVRSNSRTAMLAEHLLKKLPGDISRVKLCEITFPTADEAFLAKRDKACADKDLGNEMFSHAERFADADIIVIAAPFWDLSFPASLKQYFEQINVIGLTFEYSDDGRPVGLCKAKKLFYVTTAGGKIYNDEYGYGYVRALAEGFYGISEIVCFKAEGLDIYGTDTESVLSDAKERIDGYFKGSPAM